MKLLTDILDSTSRVHAYADVSLSLVLDQDSSAALSAIVDGSVSRGKGARFTYGPLELQSKLYVSVSVLLCPSSKLIQFCFDSSVLNCSDLSVGTCGYLASDRDHLQVWSILPRA